MNPLIDIEQLSKHYDGRAVVDRIDWKVAPGQSWALLGHNGAGKSTLIRMLMGFTPPSGGRVAVLGHDPFEMPVAARADVGFVPEDSMLPPWASVNDILAMHAALYAEWNAGRCADLLERFRLPCKARVATLSRGMNRKLMLLLALSQSPRLLLLDEPGAGLDVESRRELLGLIGEFLADGESSVVFSTHLVTDVGRIADHVAILRDGAMVRTASADDLLENTKRVRMPADVWLETATRWEAGGVVDVEGAETWRTVLLDNATAVSPLVSELEARGVERIDLPLEDVFLALGTVAGSERPA